MALLALQVAEHPQALRLRWLLLAALLLACWPLSALQRALWRQAVPAWLSALVLLAACALLAMLGNGALALQGRGLEEAGWQLSDLLRGRGWDALGLPLLVQAALHAALNLSWARQAERERTLAAQALARDAELRALRYQLQPHFLFNTLNAISGLVGAERGRDARELINRLADYLRSTLEADARHEVPLAEELAHAADYLAIEQQRLGERLRLHQQVANDLLGVPTPRWLLQPLLENAVQHGVARRADGGLVELQLRRQADRLELELLNDCPQAPDAESGQAPGSTLGTRPGTGLGTGLRNVEQRLDALYPGRHAFSAGPTPDGRYRVLVAWPAR